MKVHIQPWFAVLATLVLVASTPATPKRIRHKRTAPGPVDVQAKLLHDAHAYQGIGAAVQVHVASVGANRENQDRYRVVHLQHGGTFVGVFDGHGPTADCAQVLANLLANYLEFHLTKSPPQEALRQAILEMDQDLVSLPQQLKEIVRNTLPKDKAKKKLQKALSGAVAAMAYIKDRTAYIANLGDARVAIYGWGANGHLHPTPQRQTRDHTASSEKERKYIQSKHPGERVFWKRNGVWRLKGDLMPTRSFGDIEYKLDSSGLKNLYQLTRSEVPQDKLESLSSGPYLDSEPGLFTYHLQDSDAAIVVASDGLWERLPEASDAQGARKTSSLSTILNDYFRATRKRDVNAAVHVIRQAFGGDDRSVNDLLQRGREARDDTTVAVILLPSTKEKLPDRKLLHLKHPGKADPQQSKLHFRAPKRAGSDEL